MRLHSEIKDSLSLIDTIKYVYLRKSTTPKSNFIKLNPKIAKYPIYLRPATSDVSVFTQIFIEREYLPLDRLKNISHIIDCGANIGLSSAYFLSLFPNASLTAIEPEIGNYKMLRKNLSPYSQRVSTINGAIWPKSEALQLSPNQYRDGREWSFTVTNKLSNRPEQIQGYTIPELLQKREHKDRVLLKIDIEGAETPILKENLAWMNLVEALAIELHDDSPFGPSTTLFHNAIADKGFHIEKSGELTICIRRP